MTELTELSDWTDQYRAELEKQSSARAVQVESLLMAGDYTAIAEWLEQWKAEDKAPDSLYQRYREARSKLREERHRQRQRQLYGSVIDRITNKASAEELHSPSADSPKPTDVNQID